MIAAGDSFRAWKPSETPMQKWTYWAFSSLDMKWKGTQGMEVLHREESGQGGPRSLEVISSLFSVEFSMEYIVGLISPA